MDRKENYKQQQKLSFMQLLAEIPNFIVITISAIATGSMIVWMDFIDSLGNVLRTGAVAVLTKQMAKDLRFEYNYGVAKLEDISVLFCDSIVLGGLSIAMFLSVHELFDPEKPSGLLLLVVGIKIINVTLDAIFLRGQHKLRQSDKGMLTGSSYAAAIGMLLFDAVELCSIFLVWAFKNQVWTWYFSPIAGILIAIYMGYKCINRIKKALDELTDKTLSEEDQMRILKVMTRHHEEYNRCYSIRSHMLGGKAQIDLMISFPNEKTYKEIIALKSALQKEISELIAGCSVDILIMQNHAGDDM